MQPTRDPQLSELLSEWEVENAPASLDARVVGVQRPWWRFLLTGAVRVPVPLAVVLAIVFLVMSYRLVRTPTEHRVPANTLSLVDFRPVRNPEVRVVGRHYEEE